MVANELNLDITFEQSAFSKIYRSKTFEVWCDSVAMEVGQ